MSLGARLRLGVRAVMVTLAIGAAGLGVFGVYASGQAEAARSSPSSWQWTATLSVAPVAEQTFSPALAVIRSGAAVAGWFSGPGPIVSAESADQVAPTSPNWKGNGVVVELGSVGGGFRRPVTVARNGNDGQGGVKVALSGSGVAFLAWVTVGPPFTVGPPAGWMIATARNGRFGAPRRLGIPNNADLAQLASGLDGPVDAFWYRYRTGATGGVYGWSCSRLNTDGSLGRTIAVRYPFDPNPCDLPLTHGTAGLLPPHPTQPQGYEMEPYSLVSRSDGLGDSIAVWDDWPTTGIAYTYGMFAAIRRK